MITTSPKTFADLVGFTPRVWTGGESERGWAGDTHGTTVIGLRYDQGVLMLADRRATAGNYIMYDHAEKVLSLDDHTLLAISGSFARSIEICRFLKHAFKYYRRMTLQEMSVEGKLQEISKALAGNVPMALQGIGAFLPILGTFDPRRREFAVHFFDGMGARFQSAGYACAGSGSERIRGVFEYLIRTRGPWANRPLAEVLEDGLRMLDIAADLDSATGGFGKQLPAAYVLEASGTALVDEGSLREAVGKVLAG